MGRDKFPQGKIFETFLGGEKLNEKILGKNFWKNFKKNRVLGKYTDPRIHGPYTLTIYLLLIF